MRFLIILGLLFFCVLTVIGFVLVNRPFLIETYNEIRLEFLDGGGDECLAELSRLDADFISLGDQGSDRCPVLNAVKLLNLDQINLSSPVILSCPAAVKLAQWGEEIHVQNISHIGALNCRTMRGRRVMSEHSFGLAIDITALDDATVSKHWNDRGARGEKLRYAARQACRYFSNVLTPNTNRLHHGHFHFDNGFGYSCDVVP